MRIKNGVFPYFFIGLWSIIFGIGLITMYSRNGLIRIFGNLNERNTINSLPFLIIGILVLILFLSNLIFTYWIKDYRDKIIIRNVFKQKEINWNEISKIETLKWINLSQISIIKTKSNKKYFVHCQYKNLKDVLQQRR
ncbi:hypothetical protein [uncultured Psychroserpens sp.]|uniref:hypothetical protein n=1 Tax=uncultured Psychroserpens sp. TaxID=255436 RepID=UPI002607E9B4|nr:hypothetical protein [uncultured Psychroserpens sp.]